MPIEYLEKSDRQKVDLSRQIRQNPDFAKQKELIGLVMEKQGKYLTSFQRKLLETSLKEEITEKQQQRIKIMLLADKGIAQAQICEQLGCCQVTARYWIVMAKANQAHHWRSNPIGRPMVVNEEYLRRLKQLATKSPREVNVPNRDYQYSFKRWTAQKLVQHLDTELGIKITPQHLNRLLKQMGLSTRSKPTSEESTRFSLL